MRYKLLSAASAIAMALAAGGLQAEELTADQLDRITAGDAAVAAGATTGSSGLAVASADRSFPVTAQLSTFGTSAAVTCFAPCAAAAVGP